MKSSESLAYRSERESKLVVVVGCLNAVMVVRFNSNVCECWASALAKTLAPTTYFFRDFFARRSSPHHTLQTTTPASANAFQLARFIMFLFR